MSSSGFKHPTVKGEGLTCTSTGSRPTGVDTHPNRWDRVNFRMSVGTLANSPSLHYNSSKTSDFLGA